MQQWVLFQTVYKTPFDDTKDPPEGKEEKKKELSRKRNFFVLN